MLIALGSTNRAKLGAASAIITRLYPGAEVRPVEVVVPVPAQPINDEQTQTGAIARARASLAQSGAADLGLGMESGLRETLGGWALCLWAAAVDRSGALGVGGGVVLPLPPKVVERVLAGEMLGHLMDALAGEQDTRQGPGALGVLTGGLITRQRAFEDALVCALARWLHPAFRE